MTELICLITGVLATMFILAAIVVLITGDLIDSLATKLFVIFSLVIGIGLSVISYKCTVKLHICEDEATIAAFEDVKKQKSELGDSYIIEPSILKSYNEAKIRLDKYRRLGLYD